MSMFQAVVLGITEGVTEYLPVSSTGHLMLAEHLLGISKDEKAAADAYAISIQGGAILAVLWLYFARCRKMVSGLLGHDPDGQRLAINVIAAFLPAAVIGLVLERHIKDQLFGLGPVTVAWIAGGAFILIFAAWQLKSTRVGAVLETLTWRQAAIIGFAQCLAMWPGTSRSLVTILCGVLMGLSMSAAVEFSFLVGLITLGAATSFETLKHHHEILSSFGWGGPVVGVIVAFFSAVIAVKWMVAYLNRHDLALFGFYRILLGILVYWFILRLA
jgi:undecaprenyl-diphosphatase